jgi:hypothetical protein
MKKIYLSLVILLTRSIYPGATVYLYNNYGATLNYVISSQQPAGHNIANNVPVNLGDINFISMLTVRTVGYVMYGSTLNLNPYLIDIRNEQTKHPNDDAIIVIERSGYMEGWNVKPIIWQPRSKIKSFELADFPTLIGAPKVQPNHSQPLTQPAVTMDIGQLEKELALIEATTADGRLTHIKNGALGSDYARKATEICNADYTQAKKLGKIDLCARLKTELLAPEYDKVNLKSKHMREQIDAAKRKGQRIVEVLPDLAPAINDMKSSITRLHNSLAGYKSRGEAS